MELSVLDISEKEKWDAIVRSFAEHDVYYLSGYAQAFRLHGHGQPMLFYYEGQDIRGINVVMKRDIALDPHFAGQLEEGGYFDLATPYGYGGWLTEGEGEASPLFASYEAWCKNHNIVSEFVRFNLFSNRREDYYGQVVLRTDNIIRALDRPPEEMLRDFEHKVRKNLKKAAASGLTAETDPQGRRLSEFLDVYYSTMKRNAAESAYYFKEDFFRQINTMSGNYAYFHALAGEKVISTELVLMAGDVMYSFLGGTDSRYYSCRPNDFLKYEIIKWGWENGYKRFVLGGGYGADDGIFRYKKSFAPHGIVHFFTGQAVFDQDSYDALCGLRGSVPDSGFFPAYRA